MFQHIVHRHHVGAWQCARDGKQIRDVHQIAFQPLHNRAKLTEALEGALGLRKRNRVKVMREGPISLTLAGEPMRKYVVSWSSRPRVRTTLRMYVPTPNSVIRRMSMAIFTGGNLNTEDATLYSTIE